MKVRAERDEKGEMAEWFGRRRRNASARQLKRAGATCCPPRSSPDYVVVEVFGLIHILGAEVVDSVPWLLFHRVVVFLAEELKDLLERVAVDRLRSLTEEGIQRGPEDRGVRTEWGDGV